MSAVVKLSSKLPADEERNGLDALVDELDEFPGTIRVGVAWFDVSKIVEDTDSGQRVPVVRIRRFEPVDDEDAARKLGERAFHKRTGRTMLPLDQLDDPNDD